jgi:hypothetical protein
MGVVGSRLRCQADGHLGVVDTSKALPVCPLTEIDMYQHSLQAVAFDSALVYSGRVVSAHRVSNLFAAEGDRGGGPET